MLKRTVSVIILLALLSSFACAGFALTSLGKVRINAERDANVRKSASYSAQILGVAVRGKEYDLIELGDGEWYKIRVSSELEGWVSASTATVVSLNAPEPDVEAPAALPACLTQTEVDFAWKPGLAPVSIDVKKNASLKEFTLALFDTLLDELYARDKATGYALFKKGPDAEKDSLRKVLADCTVYLYIDPRFNNDSYAAIYVSVIGKEFELLIDYSYMKNKSSARDELAKYRWVLVDDPKAAIKRLSGKEYYYKVTVAQ